MTRAGGAVEAKLATLGLLVLAGAAALVAAAPLPSCQTYVPPPTGTVVGLSSGILNDPLAPIVVEFSTPIDPSTLSLQLAAFDIDGYGNLPDEVPDGGSLDVYGSYSRAGESHLSATVSADRRSISLVATPIGWLPTGPSLVLLIDPGLTSMTTGTVLRYRERIPFSYPATCGKGGTTRFRSGAYFFLLQVSEPIGVELKVLAAIDVNAQTGAFFGQFTAAVRNPDPSRCSPPCTGGDVCELIPSQKCVIPSTEPVSLEEYPDFVAKATSPNGYTFEMHGCASDVGDGGAVDILTAPGVLDVPSPQVSIEGLTFTAQFDPVDGGAVRASGSLTSTKTLLIGANVGPGTGTLSALSIPDAQAPANLPQPGTVTDAGVGDATDASSQ